MPSNANNPVKKSNAFEKIFEKISDKVSNVVGSPYWFVFSLLIVIVWIPSGFFLGWGEIWHLLINTTTTILTFLMMALLHSSQSKWERKIERLQYREGSDIKKIEESTENIAKRVVKDTNSKTVHNASSGAKKEQVSSLN